MPWPLPVGRACPGAAAPAARQAALLACCARSASCACRCQSSKKARGPRNAGPNPGPVGGISFRHRHSAARRIHPRPVRRAARSAEAVERALAPGDVADAAQDHQAPGEVGPAPIEACICHLPGLHQGVRIPVAIGVVDQPEPAQHQQPISSQRLPLPPFPGPCPWPNR